MLKLMIFRFELFPWILIRHVQSVLDRSKTEFAVSNPVWDMDRYCHLYVPGLSKTFRTGRLERELQMVQLSATVCSYITVLW